MPLLIQIVAAWVAGLLTSALVPPGVRLPLAASVGALILAAIASVILRRRGALVPVALTAVFIAGHFVAGADAQRTIACRTTLARESTLLVAIDERVAPGRRTNGEARAAADHECRVPVSIRVTDGAAPPGSVVRASGTFRATDRGLRAEVAVIPTGASERLRRWRGNTGETIDSLFGRDASLVRALLIADQDGIPPEMRDRFADAGLVHMLSISGLHVAIIASALLTLASAAHVPKGAGTLAALAVVTLYVTMLGAPAPAVRSAVMLATVSLSERMQRPVHAWTALALGAVIPTMHPAVVFDLGYQLSVSGMAALVAARGIMRRLRQAPWQDAAIVRTTSKTRAHSRLGRSVHALLGRVRALRGWRWQLTRECATGVIATLVTAPLIAWTFGRVSLIAPLSNLVAGPIVTFVQPALFLALVLQPFPTLARFVASATSAPLALLDRVASASAAVPFASLHIAPTLAGAVCAGVASAAFVRATASRSMLPGFIVAGFALVLGVWTPLLPAGRGVMEMHVLDVGQGDAIAIRTPRGQWVLVDAGRRWDGGDAGRRTVVPYIRRRGGSVAAFVMSHAHDDHVGGAASVVEAVRPARSWEPAFVTTGAGYRQALDAAASEGVVWQRVRPGLTLALDGVRFEVLAPDSSWTARQTDANETSVVLRVAYGAVSFLLTGDAEAAEEEWMLQNTDPALLRVDILKLGHHGSKTSSTPAFVDAVRPRLGVISVGEDNRYGHPSPETLVTFAERAIPLLRTDRDGVIVVSTDGRAVQVASSGHRWTLPHR